MRVMTWNLQWRERHDWHECQRGIVSTLETLRPDIVGLQEVWAAAATTQAELLAEQLGMHSAFGAPSLPPPPRPPERPDQAGVEVGVAVLGRGPIPSVQPQRLPAGDQGADRRTVDAWAAANGADAGHAEHQQPLPVL